MLQETNSEVEGGTRFKNAQEKSRLNKLKCTIVTVVFNGGDTIEDAIHSVLEQTYDNIEHIVIDGGSTDETLNVIRKHKEHIDYWVSEKDAGIYDAMNKGIALATGEVIGFLNADDFYADNKVVERIAAVFADPAVEACFSDLLYVTQDTRKVVRYWKSRPYKKGDFARGWCPAHPTFYIRRSVLERLGLFDQTYRLAADVEFMMRYLECGDIRSFYIPHVQVRMRVGGATNQSWHGILRQNQEIFRALRKNCVPYSSISFWGHKLASRVWQRLIGMSK